MHANLRRLLVVSYLVWTAPVCAEHIGNDLCPPTTATHTAVESGSWQEPQTWDNGVPTAGARVLVPSGVEVTNHGTTADVLWIHVAGTLSVCDHCDTQINVHTLFVPMGGAVELGTPTLPATGKTVLEFVPGPFLPGDWQQLSLGLVCHGKFTACGETKTAWTKVIAQAVKGARRVRLANYVFNWNPGDRILIAGTDSKDGDQWARYQSEFRTIDSVDGRVVTIDEPLQYKHFRWVKSLRYHVANLTRNVVIRSRETEPIAHRGHLMFMSPMVDMREVAMEGLGRTDKSRDVTDPRRDDDGVLIPGSDANPRARYAWHVHRAGPTSAPAHCIGCVVDGSPGWGFLNHASHCKWHRCIAVRCFGAGFATEEGQERGYIRQCLAAMNHGLGDRIKSTDADHGVKSIGDWGKDGSGFWLQGGMVEVSDCVSFDNSGRGFALFNRALNGYPDQNGVREHLRFPIYVDVDLLGEEYDGVAKMNPPRSIYPSMYVLQRQFERNVAYNNKIGLQSWCFNVNHNHTWEWFPRFEHAARGQIKDLTLWGRGAKLHMEYTSCFTVDGLRIIGDTGFRNEHSNITKWLSHAMQFRGPEITIRDWSVENHGAARDYFIGGANDPIPIAERNIVIEGL